MNNISKKTRGGDLFIVDNCDEYWKVSANLSEWRDLSESIDIATGYFEIGSLLSQRDKWIEVYRRIKAGDNLDKVWFYPSMSNCALEGDCNFTFIGGIFQKLVFID